MFVRLFARRLIEVGSVTRADMYEEPFVRLSAEERRLPGAEIDLLLDLAAKFEVASARA